jgi:HAE1 family hydrophobic/amphiphilic exporter-1/multidrug efflux pump
MYVKNSKGDLIQMDNIVSIEEQSKPPQLYHNNRFMAATVSAGLLQVKVSMTELKQWKIKTKVLDDTFTTDLEVNLEILLSSSYHLLWIGFY